MKKLPVLLLILLLPILSNSQNIGLGGSAMYNFQSKGIGFGARVNFNPNNTFSFVPQLAYYPKIGFSDIKVKELFIGLSIEYKLIRGNTFNYYLLAHGGYNHWSNPEESPLEDAQTANWNLEGGVGITTSWCLRPFLEYRYNIKFQETHLRFGLLYIFGCGNGQSQGTGRFGSGYRNPKRIRKTNICPAY